MPINLILIVIGNRQSCYSGNWGTRPGVNLGIFRETLGSLVTSHTNKVTTDKTLVIQWAHAARSPQQRLPMWVLQNLQSIPPQQYLGDM
jgi:hypothetical protein